MVDSGAEDSVAPPGRTLAQEGPGGVEPETSGGSPPHSAGSVGAGPSSGSGLAVQAPDGAA
eukprot:7885320-Alexandrium_andersonii.AAC.1